MVFRREGKAAWSSFRHSVWGPGSNPQTDMCSIWGILLAHAFEPWKIYRFKKKNMCFFSITSMLWFGGFRSSISFCVCLLQLDSLWMSNIDLELEHAKTGDFLQPRYVTMFLSGSGSGVKNKVQSSCKRCWMSYIAARKQCGFRML